MSMEHALYVFAIVFVSRLLWDVIKWVARHDL